jgi:hypothetical protein
MLKTGVCDLATLRSKAGTRGLFGGKRLPSISLYEEAASAPDGDRLTAEILERFADDRGAYKRTYVGRFAEFDVKAIAFLKERFTSSERLLLHDIGVSDARTACDFFEQIAADFPNIDYCASDYGSTIEIVDVGRAKVSFSTSGQPLEVMWPPFVHSINRPENFKFYPVNYLHRRLALGYVVPQAKNLLRLGKNTRTVTLWCPRALRLTNDDRRFHLLTYNLLTRFSHRKDLHLVRAMNVLNDGYFSGEQVTVAAGRILESLADGGLLMVGCNEGPGSIVTGAIYSKVSKRFALAWRESEQIPNCEPFVLAAAIEPNATTEYSAKPTVFSSC